MSLLASYLMRAILTSTMLVMLVLLALAGLFEFIGQLDSTQGEYGVPQWRNRRRRRRRQLGIDSRLERIAGKHVLDIGQHELLVLLLVIQPERHQLADLFTVVLVQQLVYRFVHVRPVNEHLADGWPRQQAALRARVHLACCVVIGIEQVVILLVVDAVPGKMRLEHELLEEPRHVGKMPARGAHIRHRLYNEILDLEVRAERLRKASDSCVSLEERFRGADWTDGFLRGRHGNSLVRTG
jgi:hypothetical protein